MNYKAIMNTHLNANRYMILAVVSLICIGVNGFQGIQNNFSNRVHRLHNSQTSCATKTKSNKRCSDEEEFTVNRTTRTTPGSTIIFDYNNRRNFIASSLLAIGLSKRPERALGVITDETATFGTTNSDSAYTPQNLGLYADPSPLPSPLQPSPSPSQQTRQATDEITFNIPMSKIQSSSSPLGIELADIEFRTNRRVYVKSIMPSSLAAQLGVQPNWIIINVNGQSTERTNAQGVKQMVSQFIKSSSSNNNNTILQLTFRDNTFQDQIQNLTSDKEVITQIAPAGDTTQRNQDGNVRVGVEKMQEDQKMVVSQLVSPKICRRGATLDDLLEISYIGRIVDTGEIFDGSAISINGKGVPGR